MHQTFYIDIDEEITSIVERLKSVRASEIILVVPKRALLLQSIVNLRILKKEADEAGLQLMIVTQDKLGKILIEKAGILVQQKMDNLSDDEINVSEENGKTNPGYYFDENETSLTEKNKERLDQIGSADYFDEKGLKTQIGRDWKQTKKTAGKNEAQKERLINKELIVGIGSDIKRKPDAITLPNTGGKKFAPSARTKYWPVHPPYINRKAKGQDEKIESFFYNSNGPEKLRNIPKNESRDYNLSKKTHRWVLIFGIVSVLAVMGILSYLFIPKTKVVISAKAKYKTIDSEIIGDANSSSSDYEKGIIPVKMVNVEGDISKSFDSTGNKSVSNQKARGTVTLYNEYGADPQTLVATTRLLSPEGKLFRLIKSVTIPGMTKTPEKNQPGIIEAEVVADESGADFNIGATTFTIPGFKDSGNEKYNKFYAKSTKSMAGGGSGGEQANFVTDQDIASAKTKILPELDDLIKQKIKEAAGEGTILLDEAVNKEEAVYRLSNSSGDIADSFQISAQAKASALVFSEKDAKNAAAYMIAKAGGGQIDISGDSVILDFGKSDPNFKTGLINIKFNAKGKLEPDIDVANIRKEILGKNEEDLKTYFNTFSDIEKAEVEYWPAFISGKIPFRASRVEVTLDNN